MQTYKITFSKAALKFLDKQDKTLRLKIYSAVYKLPYEGDIKRLVGYENKFRLRVGKYRVIYDKYDDVFVIDVIDIDSRGQVYNKL